RSHPDFARTHVTRSTTQRTYGQLAVRISDDRGHPSRPLRSATKSLRNVASPPWPCKASNLLSHTRSVRGEPERATPRQRLTCPRRSRPNRVPERRSWRWRQIGASGEGWWLAAGGELGGAGGERGEAGGPRLSVLGEHRGALGLGA